MGLYKPPKGRSTHMYFRISLGEGSGGSEVNPPLLRLPSGFSHVPHGVIDGAGFGEIVARGRGSMSEVFSAKGITVCFQGRGRIGSEVASAEIIHHLYVRHGTTAIVGGDGSYSVVLLDRQRGRVILFTDPLGSKPLYFSAAGGAFAAASFATTALGLVGERPSIHKDRAADYLGGRYLLDGQPMFRNVCRIRPGLVINFSLESRTWKEARYWDLAFSSSIGDAEDASRGLYDVLLASHERLSSESASCKDAILLLTGGLDSRGVLAFLDRLDALPAGAVTWGNDTEGKKNDPNIAAQLAKMFGVPHRIIQVDASGWCDNAAEWAEVSELLNDNGVAYAVGSQMANLVLGSRLGPVLTGDQAFGFGPLPSSTDDVLSNLEATAIRFAASDLASVLLEDEMARVVSRRLGTYESLYRNLSFSHPKDLQDYLFFHAHVFPWLLGAGNFKEPLVQVARPMLTREVIDYVCCVAPQHRVDKHLYVSMLKAKFPKLRNLPPALGTGGIDWVYAATHDGRFRTRLFELTSPERVAGSILGLILDEARYADYHKNFFSRPADCGEALALQGWVYPLRRLASQFEWFRTAVNHVQAIAKRLLGLERRKLAAQKIQMIIRIASMVQYEERMKKMNANEGYRLENVG